MIGAFRAVLCVAVFQGLLLVVVLMTAANNAVVKVSFEIQSSRVFEKSSKGRFRRIISGTLSQNSENYPLKAKFKL